MASDSLQEYLKALASELGIGDEKDIIRKIGSERRKLVKAGDKEGWLRILTEQTLRSNLSKSLNSLSTKTFETLLTTIADVFPDIPSGWSEYSISELPAFLRQATTDLSPKSIFEFVNNKSVFNTAHPERQVEFLKRHNGVYQLVRPFSARPNPNDENVAPFQLTKNDINQVCVELLIIYNQQESVEALLITKSGDVHRGKCSYSRPTLYICLSRPRKDTLFPIGRSIYLYASGENTASYFNGAMLRTTNTSDRVAALDCWVKRLGDESTLELMRNKITPDTENICVDAWNIEFGQRFGDQIPLIGKIESGDPMFSTFCANMRSPIVSWDWDSSQKFWSEAGW